jgi:hypothetical protein
MELPHDDLQTFLLQQSAYQVCAQNINRRYWLIYIRASSIGCSISQNHQSDDSENTLSNKVGPCVSLNHIGS